LFQKKGIEFFFPNHGLRNLFYFILKSLKTFKINFQHLNIRRFHVKLVYPADVETWLVLTPGPVFLQGNNWHLLSQGTASQFSSSHHLLLPPASVALWHVSVLIVITLLSMYIQHCSSIYVTCLDPVGMHLHLPSFRKLSLKLISAHDYSP
jgi:hypothetical protein